MNVQQTNDYAALLVRIYDEECALEGARLANKTTLAKVCARKLNELRDRLAATEKPSIGDMLHEDADSSLILAEMVAFVEREVLSTKRMHKGLLVALSRGGFGVIGFAHSRLYHLTRARKVFNDYTYGNAAVALSDAEILELLK